LLAAGGDVPAAAALLSLSRRRGRVGHISRRQIDGGLRDELHADHVCRAVPAGTLALGVWAGTRIKNTADFAIAGRRLPLIMVVTTTFATWFGAETVMGIPAKFVQGGLNAIVEDPFGAGTCLILVGVFFAARLYRQNLLTIGDFYRKRFGTGIEVFCSVAIILSYLGWVAAQITALGLVFSVLTNGAMSETTG
jgi:Na+/proline symporter